MITLTTEISRLDLCTSLIESPEEFVRGILLGVSVIGRDSCGELHPNRLQLPTEAYRWYHSQGANLQGYLQEYWAVIWHSSLVVIEKAELHNTAILFVDDRDKEGYNEQQVVRFIDRRTWSRAPQNPDGVLCFRDAIALVW